MQGICWRTASNGVIKALGLDPQHDNPLAQGVSVDSQQVRSAELIATCFSQRVLEQGLLEGGKRMSVKGTPLSRIDRQPLVQRTLKAILLARFAGQFGIAKYVQHTG